MFRAQSCPKHVEQAIRSAIKIHLLHLVGILFPHNIDDARSKPHERNQVNIKLSHIYLFITLYWKTL
jgi:hypothetical protein